MAYTQAAGLAFWKDLDNQTLYSSEGRKILGQAKAQDIQTLFFQAKQQGQYPGLIQASLTPAKKAAWQKLSKLQRDLFTHHFGGNWDDIRSAFEDFAQGVLVDNDANRAENNDWTHMMDGEDGSAMIGYHRWHASIRTIQLLDADPWWEILDAQVALAWSIQSTAKPKQRPNGNPGIAADVIAQLRAAWLPLTADQRDKNFLLTVQPIGFHPNPLHPAV